jgi:Tol biopolymer transport system component
MILMVRRALALLAFGGAALPIAAQRRPVLPQIRVPHSYYYRESYLPQLTSGPSSATWSPTARELIYSMQGSLWRQTVDSDLATQLTDGPGYHYQPDWSPDGRFVVFVTYHNDAMQLRLLDVQSGVTSMLRDDGAVNVEPRWSPTGDRLAWVSTSFEGRWHIFVAPFEGGRLGTPTRITDDKHSGLPRYYYAPHDHYLSPSWSPDGREIFLVSNRGRIWGSGGFWRMEARPGAPMREVHYEETTWKGRPDWSRDGRRVVYASYAGRQWHQLWLLSIDPRRETGEGRGQGFNPADPFQLTYGDFDATAPRWSPDGRAIAYASNERGNTSLWVLAMPGGGRREVVARRRVYRNPTGTLRLVVTEGSGGATIPARLSVRAADGRSFGPNDGWIHADDGFDRSQRGYEFTYFHAGTASLTLPAGTYRLEALRGTEYAHLAREVVVPANVTTTVRLPLTRIDHPAARGWVSGDLHVHMNYTGTYRNTPERLARQAHAEGLQVVENLIVNKESRIPDMEYFTGRARTYPGGVLIAHDEEYHTSFWGHSGLLGLRENIVMPNYAAYVNTAAGSLFPTNSEIFRNAKAQGAVVGYVHPFDVYPNPRDSTRALTHAFPVDVALGNLDYYEAVGFNDDIFATQRVWYSALNCGFRIAAGGGTDAMANYASLRGPVGMNRVYVRTPGRLTHRGFLDGLKAGRTFATNGPLVEFTLGPHAIGDRVTLGAGGRTFAARVRLRSMVPMDHLEIVQNGKVTAQVPMSNDRKQADATVPITIDRSGWVLVRAWSDAARHPVLDVQPFGTTSPIYFQVGDMPHACEDDARYFVDWVDRLRAAAAAFTDWNDATERSTTLRTLDEARAAWLSKTRTGGVS